MFRLSVFPYITDFVFKEGGGHDCGADLGWGAVIAATKAAIQARAEGIRDGLPVGCRGVCFVVAQAFQAHALRDGAVLGLPVDPVNSFPAEP